jgi:hypothetical protein
VGDIGGIIGIGKKPYLADRLQHSLSDRVSLAAIDGAFDDSETINFTGHFSQDVRRGISRTIEDNEDLVRV